MKAAEPRRPVLAGLAFVLGLALVLACAGPAGAQELELIGAARISHLATSATVRPAPHQTRLTEIRVRSGSLALHLEAVEIVFADGGLERAVVQESLAPGHRSRPIPVDGRRPVREILVMKRPGMRPGETILQVLGRVTRGR